VSRPAESGATMSCLISLFSQPVTNHNIVCCAAIVKCGSTEVKTLALYSLVVQGYECRHLELGTAEIVQLLYCIRSIVSGLMIS